VGMAGEFMGNAEGVAAGGICTCIVTNQKNKAQRRKVGIVPRSSAAVGLPRM